MKELTQTQAQLGSETQQSQKGGGDMDMEALANQFIEYLMESFYHDVEKEKRPRNLAMSFMALETSFYDFRQVLRRKRVNKS